ncbi:YjzD family protein [Bacillus sp. Hm123]|uniref:YjzD family protein n=1 Tax=Bacillus sp. Hm123 TaxID=3450745 RepID=UPI003F43DBED
MQYIMTFFWSFLLIQMLSYVVGSMVGAEFTWLPGTIISIIVAILLFVISALVPNDPVEHH